MKRYLLILSTLLIPLTLASQTTNPEYLETESCLACHDDPGLEGETARGAKLDLYVPENALEGSVHEGLDCVDCHRGEKTFEDYPHNDGNPLQLQCVDCHDDVVDEYLGSIHGISSARGDNQAAKCADCHGSHQILSSDNRESKTHKFNLHKTCAACHQNEEVLKTHKMGDNEAVGHYVDSTHGRALLVDGLAVAPVCNDCHGVHDILPSEHVDSRVHKDNVPKVCGNCHVLVEDIYEKSVHGRLLANHDDRGPVCVTCHSAHEISKPLDGEFRGHADQVCGQCHEEQYHRYQETFHGKAMALGREEVATCFDCHGHHDIMESDHPDSHISPENKLATCQKCHPSATENFADYIVHADHMDKESYPGLYWTFMFMTVLLVGTFIFFAIHSLLWLFRSLSLFVRDSREFRLVKAKVREDREEFVRFQPIDRFLHGLIIFSFLLLVVTGMPLKFFHAGWAQAMLAGMGGQHVAAVLHRVGAIITVFYFSVHICAVIIGFIKRRHHFRNPDTGKVQALKWLGSLVGPDSPVPNWQDFKDFVNHQKWFFGKGEKPQFDRWTYWEKFDYMAVFWGVAVIGLSGLIMWFPEFFTRFMPGWIINIALIVHSDEALLAAGFIFTFHFFNVHFRPEKFPMDPVIFSGKISKTELLHERKRLYERWEKDGELEEHRVKDQWEAWKKITLPAGFMAFLVGVALLALILYAMLSRLLGDGAH